MTPPIKGSNLKSNMNALNVRWLKCHSEQIHFTGSLTKSKKEGLSCVIQQCADHDSDILLFFVARKYLQIKLHFNKLLSSLQITTIVHEFFICF
jgi:hypothetical protein